jgi:hypothetical protein
MFASKVPPDPRHYFPYFALALLRYDLLMPLPGSDFFCFPLGLYPRSQ